MVAASDSETGGGAQARAPSPYLHNELAPTQRAPGVCTARVCTARALQSVCSGARGVHRLFVGASRPLAPPMATNGGGGAGSGIIFQWLERIGLGHVVPVFEERGIHNPQLLMKLEVDDYDAVGVTSGACVRACGRARACPRSRARMPAVARGCLRTCAWSCAWSRGGLGRPRPDEARR